MLVDLVLVTGSCWLNLGVNRSTFCVHHIQHTHVKASRCSIHYVACDVVGLESTMSHPVSVLVEYEVGWSRPIGMSLAAEWLSERLMYMVAVTLFVVIFRQACCKHCVH